MTTTSEKGYAYELYIRDHIRSNLQKQAFLWKDTPEPILISNNIIGSHNIARLIRKENIENPLQDTGIDIIQIDDEGRCHLVQCKNGYQKGLVIKDLAGFSMWMMYLDKLSGSVYYTDKLSLNLQSFPANPRIQFIKQEHLANVNPPLARISIFIPDDSKLEYQMKAKSLADTYFETNKRGIIAMPCGTGKTYTSYLVSHRYNHIVIISPLKQFAKQNLDRFLEYGYDGNTILVDSDGIRDANKIKKIITKSPKILLSATYDSVDVINKLVGTLKEPLIIVDEFHNISKKNLTDQDDDFNCILVNMNLKILFMSATPRIYELEADDEDDIEIGRAHV